MALDGLIIVPNFDSSKSSIVICDGIEHFLARVVNGARLAEAPTACFSPLERLGDSAHLTYQRSVFELARINSQKPVSFILPAARSRTACAAASSLAVKR
jgi:hypothetical protein